MTIQLTAEEKRLLNGIRRKVKTHNQSFKGQHFIRDELVRNCEALLAILDRMMPQPKSAA